MKSALNSTKELRAKILAEMFLKELRPKALHQSFENTIPFDYWATFSGNDGTLKTYAIEIKVGEQLSGTPRFRLGRKLADALKTSEPRVLLLVPDVKENTVYFNWASELGPDGGRDASLPLLRATRENVSMLKRQLVGA